MFQDISKSLFVKTRKSLITYIIIISVHIILFDIFTRNSCIDRVVKIIQVYISVFNLVFFREFRSSIVDPSTVSVLWLEEHNINM